MATAKKDDIIYESDIRADSKTPLGAVLYAPSGKMTGCTAEQKIFARRNFLSALISENKGGTQGEHPGEFCFLWVGPKEVPRGMSA